MEQTLDIEFSRKQISTLALSLWLMILFIFMLFARHFDYEIFFVLGFMGVLAIAEIVGPRYVKPGFLRHFRYLVVAGMVVFGAIVIWHVIQIMSR